MRHNKSLVSPSGDIFYVDESHVVFQCGTGLVSFDLESPGDINIIANSCENGVSTFAVNACKGYIAFAPRTSPPPVYVLSFPENKVVCSLAGGPSLEYEKIVFSHNADRICAVSGVTENRLYVYDILTANLLVTARLPGTNTMPFVIDFISTNPSSAQMICTGGRHGIAFWKVKSVLNDTKIDVVKAASISMDQSREANCETDGFEEEYASSLHSASNNFVAHSWSMEGTVFAINGMGTIVEFDAYQGLLRRKVLVQELNSHSVSMLMVFADYLIVACSDGMCRWLHTHKLDVVEFRSGLRHAHDPAASNLESTGAILTCCPSPSHSHLLIVTDRGTMHILSVDSVYESGASPSASCVVESHFGPVTGMCEINIETCQTSHLVTAGVDGTVRLWDTAVAQCGSYQFWSEASTDPKPEAGMSKSDVTGTGTDAVRAAIPITSVASSPHHPILGIGLAPGIVYFMHIGLVKDVNSSDSIEIVPLANLQLYKQPVTALVFHPTEMLLAVACSLEQGVYIINIDPNSKHVFTVMAYAISTGDTLTLTWHNKQLLIFTSSDSVACLDISDLDNSNPNLDPLAPSRVKFPNAGAIQTTRVVSLSNQDCFYAVFPHLPHVTGCILAPTQLEVKVEQYPQHEHAKGLLCLDISDDGTHLVTGDADGSLIVSRFSDGDNRHKSDTVSTFPRAHNGAVLCVRFIQGGSAICSAGLDSAVFIFFLPEKAGHSISRPSRALSSFSSLAEHARHLIERPVPRQRPTHRQVYLTRQAEAHSLDAQAQKAVRYNIIADLRHRLNELLTKNDLAPDLEKLDRGEFVIDCKGRDCILDANRNRVGEIHNKLVAEDAQRDQISSNIRRDCWDSMDNHATECRAMVREMMSVTNFPLSTISKAAERQTECVSNFRKLELRDIMLSKNTGSTAWPGRADMVPSNILWIVNEGALRAEGDVPFTTGQGGASILNADSGPDHQQLGHTSPSSFAEEEEEDGEMQTPSVETINAESLFTQVYPPTVVTTTNQKRSQMLLINKLIRSIQTNFNTKFSKLHQLKRDELEKIEEKNLRACSILDELRSEEALFKPQLSRASELPETVLVLAEEEVSVRPYESSKKIRERESQDGSDTRGADAVEKWDTNKRALEDMMFGTMETKHDLDILKVELQPPSWLDGSNLETLTEEQERELIQYETASRLLEEERAKHRKALELELKKLKTEIHDIARTFDEKIKLLVEERIHVMDVSMTQEFYMLRLSVGILDEEWALHMANSLKKKEVTFKRDLETHEMYILEFKDLVDNASQRVEGLQNEDRQLERNFRKDIQTEHSVDQDTMRLILTIYRYRPTPNETSDVTQSPMNLGQVQPTLSSGVETNSAARQDSFFRAATSERKESISHKNVVQEEVDVPDGLKIDTALLDSTRMLRQRKLQKEAEIAQADANLKELKLQLADMVIHGRSMQNDIQGINKQQSNFIRTLMLSDRNTGLLVRLKQGQDEVEQEAVVTDYSDAVLIPVDIVHGVNNEIRRLGAEQTKVLTKIKHFRKSINFMDWENQYMEEQAHDLEEYYTDLQLLHVTKNLQSIMKGDPGKREREHTMKVESRIKMMGVVHDENCSKLKHANAKLAHQVRDRDEENERLKQQLKELEGSVTIRESILKSHVENHGGELNPAQQAANSMKRIILRRRLIDLARLQTEEIDFLRQELDRLRQRTFPSFAHATRNRFQSPADVGHHDVG